MKKILIFTILMGISCVGCTEWTPEQHMAWQNFWQKYSQQQQNLTYQQNMQLRDNARDINRQLQKQPNPNYWQERRAQQEYMKEQNDYYRRMGLYRP